jgi:hypothetical protein
LDDVSVVSETFAPPLPVTTVHLSRVVVKVVLIRELSDVVLVFRNHGFYGTNFPS